LGRAHGQYAATGAAAGTKVVKSALVQESCRSCGVLLEVAMRPELNRSRAVRRILAGLGVVALAYSPSSARSESWAVYHDSIYDCRLEYPSFLFTQEPLDLTQEAQRFSGPNTQTYFRVMGVNNKDGLTPEGVKAKYRRSDVPGEIVYERTTSDFLVLSGYRGDSIFYTKVSLSADERNICILEITYPRGEKRTFDDVVTRMSRSFVAGN
jgi:hypothetical protein